MLLTVARQPVIYTRFLFHPGSNRPGNLTVENKVKNLASNIGFKLIGCIFLNVAVQIKLSKNTKIAPD